MIRSRLLALMTAIVVIGSAIGGGWYWYTNSIEKRLGDARKAIRDGDYDLADERVQNLLETNGSTVVVRELALRLADEKQDPDNWLKHATWLVENGGDDSASYALGIADLSLIHI